MRQPNAGTSAPYKPRSKRRRSMNAPSYGDSYGAINGRPLPYRYGGDKRGRMRGGDLDYWYGGNGPVRA